LNQSQPSTSSQPALKASNPGKKGKESAKSTAAPAAVNATPANAAATLVEGGAVKKSKNQLKKETRGQTNQKYWDEVAQGLRPDPRLGKGEKKNQQQEGGDQAKASGAVPQAIEIGDVSKSKKSASSSSSGGSKAATATSAATSSTSSKRATALTSSASAAAAAAALSKSAALTAEDSRKRAMQTSLQYDDPKRKASAKKRQILNRVQTPRELDLFSHMPQQETYTGTVSDAILLHGHSHIPAHFVTYGLQIASKQIQGSNARNLALIDALMAYLETFTPPPSKQFHVDLDLKMKPIIQYVVDSRPLSIGQANIINFLKLKMSDVGSDISITTTEDARKVLIRHLKTFKDIHILAADQAIQEKVSSKIQDQDIILTFGRSYIVSKSLQLAAKSGKQFKVIVLDSNPRFEGVRTLQELADNGIELEYSCLSAISYFMKGVTKVLVGASAMLGNGQLYSRAGTSIVCMMAHTYRVPVLVACETYKFSEKVQMDAITRNEVDDPDLLSQPNLEGHCALKNWKSQPKLKMLNLVYDLTPSEFIDMIITEHGPVPPTSVPALIREFHTAI
jgi:translation initiation factor eIF-2B subunit delta